MEITMLQNPNNNFDRRSEAEDARILVRSSQLSRGQCPGKR